MQVRLSRIESGFGMYVHICYDNIDALSSRLFSGMYH